MRSKVWQDTAVTQGLITFLILRIFLTLWAVLVLTIIPVPETPDEVVRPYLGQPILSAGVSGKLFGPWQRFDTLHYTRIADQNYVHEEDSVFPPLYPWAIRGLAFLFGGRHSTQMAAGVLIANLACLGLFILFPKVVASEMGPDYSGRALLYFAIFPAAFFLLAPYSEALFLLFALASLWAARRGHFAAAGILGLLASFTRLTGWVLVIPLAYEFWRQRLRPVFSFQFSVFNNLSWRVIGEGAAVLLPGVGTFLFLVYRWAVGLPMLSHIYVEYWYQVTGIPGTDLLRALQTMFLGGQARAGEFTLWFDFFCAILLLVTTAITFKRIGITWGLYAAMMLFFMLLPVSDLKPLYSFSRYTLAFFPTFMLLSMWGKNSIVHRLILYPSLILYLYFSGQFFIWGWVA
ncbi:MAG: hypothetical protein GY796_04420 [Chloroflexi bacterium]|nr:hypothetical protein [Chloroflexota bacterium]